MSLGKTHRLLCVACRTVVTTEYPYPERTCGYQTSVRENSGTIHVCCTQDEGNEDCGRGVHYDRFVQRRFEVRGSLRASNDGTTSRA